MPLYSYQILDEKGNSTGEFLEIIQKMSDEALTKDPETGVSIRRVICAPSIRDSRPAWERCSDVRDHIRSAKPKWISDKEKGIRIPFDPKKHG